MRYTMRGAAGILAVVFGLCALLAAGTVTVGGPGASGTDWSQEFYTNNGGFAFTAIQSFLETPGVNFAGPFTGAPSFPAGWTSTQVNPQYVLMSGPNAGDFYFNLGVTSSPSVPFTVDFDIWNGTTFETNESGSASWTGSAWTYGSLLQPPGDENTTPEPATLLLFATGILGLGLVVRRARLARVS